MRRSLPWLVLPLAGLVLADAPYDIAGAKFQRETTAKCATWDSTTSVTAQTVEFPVEWSNYTITGMKSAVSGGGSFTVAVAINGTNVAGLSSVSVSGTSNVVTNATGANSGVINDQITIVVSSPSGTVNQAYVCPVFSHSQN